MRRAKANYVTGLSATVTRKDGLHPIVFMQCGPVRHWVDAKAQAAARPFARTVVELDGPQYLGDAEAYRRDRRKDALLQENGYVVLRFLAEDVGKQLDDVLDAIIRALSFQQVGAAAMLSRAVAGVVGRNAVFVLPGSP